MSIEQSQNNSPVASGFSPGRSNPMMHSQSFGEEWVSQSRTDQNTLTGLLRNYGKLLVHIHVLYFKISIQTTKYTFKHQSIDIEKQAFRVYSQAASYFLEVTGESIISECLLTNCNNLLWFPSAVEIYRCLFTKQISCYAGKKAVITARCEYNKSQWNNQNLHTIKW